MELGGSDKSDPLLDGSSSSSPRRWQPKSANPLLVVYSLGLLLTSVVNAIAFKEMTNALPNYTWFLSITCCSVYVPIFGIISIATALSGQLDASNVEFPKSRFAVMGMFDALLSIMSMLGGAYTTGATQVVLAQAAIPVTLAATAGFLGTEYHILQYIGACVMIVGVAAAKVPSIIWPSGADASNDVFAFNLIFLATCLPNAMGTVYKEIVFRDVDIDVNYMQCWVAVFQFVFGFCLAPIQNLPFLGPHRVPFSEMYRNLINGSRCLLLRTNSIIENCGGLGQRECDDCGRSFVPYLCYMANNILYNIFSLLVVKHGGATLSFLISTFRLPLTSFAFYSTTIMGPNASTPRISDFVGLAILVLGLVLYRIGGQRIRSDDDVKQVHLFSAVMEPVPNVLHMCEMNRQSAHRIRSNLYWRLAVASPLHSPELRQRVGSDVDTSPERRWHTPAPYASSPTLSSPDIPRRWRRLRRSEAN